MTIPIPNSPFPQEAFSYLASAEYRHWWFRSRNQIIIWALRGRVCDFRNFIEVGCGTGFVIHRIAMEFPKLSLEASEYFENALDFARHRVPQCKFKRLDARKMNDSEVYDCIGSFDVIEHIEADELVLENFYRALRSGGLLLLTVPQHPWLWSLADEYAHHVRRYKHYELCNKVQNVGFQIEYCSSFVSLLLPFMALHRLVPRKSVYNPDDEFMIGPVFNGFLFLVMQIELILLKLGLRFPAGGSLLLLARKP